MGHENEYHENMTTMLELIWGEGYMAPGGAGNVARAIVGDVDPDRHAGDNIILYQRNRIRPHGGLVW